MHPLLLLQHDRPLAGFSPKKCSSAKPGSASDLISSTNPLAASQVRNLDLHQTMQECALLMHFGSHAQLYQLL